MADDVLHGIKELTEANPALMALLPGGVWTRPIKPNAPGETSTPGATPEAFDAKGRLLRCMQIGASPGSLRDFSGPPMAYWDAPEITLRCLPHESEKRKLMEAGRRLLTLAEEAIIAGPAGEAFLLTAAGLIGPFDDPILQPAVVYLVRIRVDSVWRALA
jgi:hypothetical protein